MVATDTQKQPNSTFKVGSKDLVINCETEGRRELWKLENKSIF